MKTRFTTFVALFVLAALPARTRPLPTAAQQTWENDELGMFFHFDIEVFDPYYQVGHPRGQHGPPVGSISPALFNPTRLDTDQWLRVARSMGARYAVFTAKHDSGFLMWQSDLYPYGVRQSPWRDGHGDVVADFLASCRRYGIDPGLYCSAGNNSWWRLHHGDFSVRGGRIRGDAGTIRQLEALDVGMYGQLWRRAGPLRYLWFDGGVDWIGSPIAALVAQLEPDAVCFNGPGMGVPGGLARWSGNEKGYINYPSWDTTNVSDDQHDRGPGDPEGRFWIPVETNIPLRYHSWFWRSDDEDRILSLSELTTDYLLSVGRGGNFIINANIDPDGLVPEADARRFAEFGRTLRAWFGQSLAETAGSGPVLELRLSHPQPIDCVTIMEDIAQGQRIRAYTVEGRGAGGLWRTLCSGESVGHKRVQPFARTSVDAVRLRATRFSGRPVIRKLAVYNIDFPPPDPNNPAFLPDHSRPPQE